MLRLFKKIKYAIISKYAERKIDKVCGCEFKIRINVQNVSKPDGKKAEQIKIEVTADSNDCKKLINSLLKKGQ